MSDETAHIVYLSDRILLDKGPYADWRAIQEKYADFKTSLGPCSEAEIIEFMESDWKDESAWPISKTAIRQFFRSDALILNEGPM